MIRDTPPPLSVGFDFRRRRRETLRFSGDGELKDLFCGGVVRERVGVLYENWEVGK